MTKVQVVQIDNIIMDSTTQARAMNGAQVYDYAELMQDGTVFPPVVIFRDSDGNHWLADGFHRVAAAKEAGLKELQAEIHEGSQRDAILYSLGPANNSHGMALTRLERRERVVKLLQDPEWSQWSDREIARHCGVSHPTVAQIRRDTGKFSSERMGADGRVQTVKHWGHSNGMAFWQTVQRFGLNKHTILEQLQAGATHLTDLTMSKEDCWRRLDYLATQQVAVRFPVGSYVKHTTGRFGQVKQAHATSLRVWDFKLEMEASWALDGCSPSTKEAWEKSSDQQPKDVQSEFHFGQVCHIWTDCAIWGFDEDGKIERTIRHIPEWTRVEFVRAFQSGRSIFAEVSWGGSPTRIPLGGLRAGEPPAPEANQTPEQPAESQAITPGQQVVTPSGHKGTVMEVSGRVATVETVNGSKPYAVDKLELQDSGADMAQILDMEQRVIEMIETIMKSGLEVAPVLDRIQKKAMLSKWDVDYQRV